nr:4-oxalocrotonate tautomerase [uncultured bacterium]
MESPMTEMPEFKLNVCHDAGSEDYIVSCSIIGQVTGVRGVVRTFRSHEEFCSRSTVAESLPIDMKLQPHSPAEVRRFLSKSTSTKRNFFP